MKFTMRYKVCIFIVLITLVLSLIVYLTSSDTLIVGYRVHNGVESISYTEKDGFIFQTMLSSVFGSLLWNTIANWNDRKILSEPDLQSYRIRRAIIDIIGFIFASSGALCCIANLIIN